MEKIHFIIQLHGVPNLVKGSLEIGYSVNGLDVFCISYKSNLYLIYNNVEVHSNVFLPTITGADELFLNFCERIKMHGVTPGQIVNYTDGILSKYNNLINN